MTWKKQLPIATNNDNSETSSWNRVMDYALVNAFMHEFEKDNTVNGTFTTTVYDNIIVETEISALFENKKIMHGVLLKKVTLVCHTYMFNMNKKF
jgi:hypothetical protein